MAPRFTRFLLASNVAASGGAVLSTLELPTAAGDVRRVMGEEKVDLVMPMSAQGYSQLLERRVLQALWEDNGTQTIEEWRIATIVESRAADGGLSVQVSAKSIQADLGAAPPVSRTESSGAILYDFEAPSLTVTEHINTYILPALAAWGISWVALGTIDPTWPVDLNYGWTSPLAALLQLANETGCEFRLRKNGTTNYLIDIVTTIGSSAATARFRFGRNIQALRRTRDPDDMATVVFPRGTPEDGVYPSLSRALWVVTSTPSGTRAVLADPLGGDPPILEDNQLNLLYARKWPSGAIVSVTASSASLQEITTGAAHGLAPGDLVQFCNSSTGGELTWLYSPARSTSYGTVSKVLERVDLPGTVNLLTNPAMRNYAAASNAPPDNWGLVGNLSTNNADKVTTSGRWKSGGKSCLVVGTADGTGIETPYAAVAPTVASPYFSGFMTFWNDTSGGRVRVDMVAGKATVSMTSITRSSSTATATTGSAHGLAVGQWVEITGAAQPEYNGLHLVRTVPSSTTYTFDVSGTPATPATGTILHRSVWIFPDPSQKPLAVGDYLQWIDAGVAGIDLNALGATVCKLRIVQDGTTAVSVYVDSAQLTQTAAQRPFIEGSGPTRLWQAANRFLELKRDPVVSYDLEPIDVGAIDARLWPDDAINLGAAATLADVEWGLSGSTRILEIRRDYLVPGKVGVGLSNRPEDLTDSLVRPRRVARLLREADTFTDPVPNAYITPVTADPTQALVALVAQPAGAVLYYWIGDKTQSLPQIGNITSGAATSTQWGTYVTPFTVSRVQSENLLLAVYAVSGAKISQPKVWTLDRDTSPTVSLSLTQPSTTQVRADWTPDIDCVRVRVYARRVASPGAVAWPTVDGTQAAQVSETYFLREMDVNVAGGGVDLTGNSVAGGVSLTIDQSAVVAVTSGAWANGDKAAVILVPKDRSGNWGSTRGEGSLTFAVAAPVVIASLTVTRTTDGTVCSAGSGANFSIAWTEGATAWSDATHDLKLYVRVNGTSWQLITTVASPHSTASYNYVSEWMKTNAKFDPTLTFDFKAELYDTGPTLLSTKQQLGLTMQSTCPVA